jgi:hypothetical protein
MTKMEALGYREMIEGAPWHQDYDTWPIAHQQDYESGRLQGAVATAKPVRKSKSTANKE